MVSKRWPSGTLRERELDGRAALRGHDAEPAALLVQPHEHVLHPGAGLELVVERLVVRAVDVDEPLDVVGRERLHLRLEAGPADRLHQLLVGVVAAEHLARRVPHRGEDDRAGVDDGAVEVEEDGLEPHASIVSAAVSRLRRVAEVSDFRYLVVPHTHWDREWYLPFEQFRLRLGAVVDGVLDTLERDPSFTSFTLDGQAIVLEDYVDVRPENEGRLRRAARRGAARGRPVVRPARRDPRRRRVARPQPPARPASLPPLRRRAERRRLPARQLRPPGAAAADPRRLRHPHVPLLARPGRRDRRRRRRLPLARRPGRGRRVPDAPALRQLRAPDVAPRRGGARARDRRALRRARCAAPARTRSCSRTAPTTCRSSRELPEILAGLGADASARRSGSAATTTRARRRRTARARGRARRQPAPERPARRQLGADLPQAGERARRAAAALDRDGCRAADAARATRRSRPPTCGSRGATCSATIRTTRSAAARATRCTGTCSSATSSSTGRSTIVEREALGVGGALVEHAAVPAAPRSSTGRLVELDGFCGRRPEPLPARRAADRPRRDRGAARVRGRAGRRRPLHVLSRRQRLATAQLVASRREGDGARARARAAGDPDRDDDPRIAGLDRVELTSVVENEADDHRLRVPSAREGARTRCGPRASSPSCAGRSSPPPPRADWVEPPVPDRAHARRRRARRRSCSSRRGCRSTRRRRDGLRLTLLRCVGTISRPAGLATRPLAAGPDIATPDGQCRGRHVFEYALRFDGDASRTRRSSARARTTAPTSSAATRSSRRCELGGDVVFSCLKQAEDGNGLVLRVFNPNPQPEDADAELPARRIRLDEEEDVDGGLELAPGEIATFLSRRLRRGTAPTAARSSPPPSGRGPSSSSGIEPGASTIVPTRLRTMWRR